MAKGLSLIVCIVSLLGCDNSSSNERREWSPKDHDGNARTTTASVGGARAKPSARPTAKAPAKAPTGPGSVAYAKHCARCHGVSGRGDGPDGPALKAPDLTQPEFKKRATKAEIAEIIKKGRNVMPPFDKLPPEVVDQLVTYVRNF